MSGWEGVGISKPAAIAGAIGALLSLQYLEELHRWQRAMAVATGFFVCVFATPLVLHGFHSWLVSVAVKPERWDWLLSAHTESGLAFLLGLFGMSAAGTVMKIIKIDIRKWLGRRLGGPDNRS